jgi:hypothetical protein
MKLLTLLFILSSCSFFIKGKDGPKSAKGSLYSVQFDKSDWIKKKDKRSDYVFENSKDGRILLSNSFCDEFQEKPLDQLAIKTFSTIKNFKSSLSTYTTFNDREAYRVEGTGEVDGVQIKLHLLNTRRNNCYFDFFAITPLKAGNGNSSFNDFLGSVVFK